ncbi:LLM class flavin-dependent oxidoreductase [Psychromicrobium lacuslunae]|uniref:FMN-linked alkanal monooxygenase n=1 Tax=Psychromicrobium lacuslunae TaxID=1618207 RepID=A0A0D4BVB5_9MICC|nr:LLM class flavin-dependent oxidoreductase [Psychromicrobium lacuslunae]AJT40382.1 FMN-linked alkanal monooxygenase [Psychromicrobium lacuslunae]
MTEAAAPHAHETKVPLSVLDLASVGVGRSSAQALAASTRLVQAADRLGYARYWVAEHHNMPAVASTNPPVLMAHLAAATERIKLGSGGVMLPNHAPLVVAEQFALLEALHPGRIDLGIGRAPGTDGLTAQALRRHYSPSGGAMSIEDFPLHVMETMAMLGDVRPELMEADSSLRGPRASLAATPNAESYPEIWLLGSSGYSAQMAGMLGLRYSYAHHFAPDALAAVDLYRRSFQPSAVLAEPHVMIATSALIAESQERAEFLAGPSRVQALALRTGMLGPIVTPEQAAERVFSEAELAAMKNLPAIKTVGTAETVIPELRALVAETGADELMVTGYTYEVEDRINTLEALARNW